MERYNLLGSPKMTTLERDAAVLAGRLPVLSFIENTDTTPHTLQFQTDTGVWQTITGNSSLTPAQQIWIQ